MDTMNFLSNTIYVPNINTKFLETMKNSHRRNDAIWLEHYFNLVKYYHKHGNIDVNRFQNKDIYYWLSRQRHEYGKPNHGSLTYVRIGLLNNLDMKWDLQAEAWDDNYYVVEKYYQDHGTIDIPQSYVTKDGFKPGVWLENQKLARNGKIESYINEDRVQILDDLEIKWNVRDEKWMQYYNALKNFYSKNYHSNVPQYYVTEDNLQLGAWLRNQRLAYFGKGTYHIERWQIKLLNDLNVDWSPNDTRLLNRTISNLNIEKYEKVLLARFSHVLDDIKYEEDNMITDSNMQKRLVNSIERRVWR